ncbi:MAG: sulfotransferase family protein [Cyclobacteriaceae bacterium]
MIVNLISGPRNISTALMYSFAQRSDTKVLDEPFYGHYLQKIDVDHPGKEETIQSQHSDPADVIGMIEEYQNHFDVVFVKNMAHHHEVLDLEYLKEYNNVFLIRDPKQLIASFAQVIEQPTMQDIGLKLEAEMLDYVIENTEGNPVVLDSNIILADPQAGLESLCKSLGIPFEDSMLSWKEGPIPEDGTWAKYWYKNVHNSTGFMKQKTSERALPQNCMALYENAVPYYEKLATYIS